ncbi:glutamate-rich WD repeat-containing protein 1-like [Hordeum vulgare]|nr:glutamate-rich WD repeat-containing protein 1-like [Hordeum vulgare]
MHSGGEELQFDPEAYNYLRGFSIGWPCLSFDVVQDQLGLVRSEFPHTLYGVAGTQAEKAPWNYIGVYKLSNINGKKREPIPSSKVEADSDMDSDSSSDEEEEEEINEDIKPILHLKRWPMRVCKQDTLHGSTTTHMCYMGRHRSCSGVGLQSFLNSIADSRPVAHKKTT